MENALKKNNKKIKIVGVLKKDSKETNNEYTLNKKASTTEKSSLSGGFFMFLPCAYKPNSVSFTFVKDSNNLSRLEIAHKLKRFFPHIILHTDFCKHKEFINIYSLMFTHIFM